MENQSRIPHDTHSSFKACPGFGAKARRTEKQFSHFQTTRANFGQTFLLPPPSSSSARRTEPGPIWFWLLLLLFFWGFVGGRRQFLSYSQKQQPSAPTAGTPVELSNHILGWSFHTRGDWLHDKRRLVLPPNVFAVPRVFGVQRANCPRACSCVRDEERLELLSRRAVHARRGNTGVDRRTWQINVKLYIIIINI